MNGYRLFLVEDEASVATELQRRLSSFGYRIMGWATTGEETCQQVPQMDVDLVLMGIRLRGPMSGIEAAARIYQEWDVPVVYLTSLSDGPTLERACQTAPFGYVLKPVNCEELRVTIEVAIRRHRAERQLQQRERWLGIALESNGDAVIATDRVGRVNYMNPPAEWLTGWNHQRALGHDMGEIVHLTLPATGASPDPLREIVEEGRMVSTHRHVLVRSSSGKDLPVDQYAAPIRDVHQKVSGMVLVLRDCSEQLRAERREMRSRQELHAFTEAVSHDLRSPLTTVLGCINLLNEREGQGIDHERARLIQIARESSCRIGSVLDGYLRLAKLQRREMQWLEIDMHEMVAEVFGELPDPAGRATFQLGNLPPAHGDPDLLRQVWVNLLSNAFKYCARSSSPRVEVGGWQTRTRCCYYVKDNGAGFDMRDRERLFRPFQRLHSENDFNGIGLGLSIVERILEQHRGSIWAKGRPEHGATFTFSLPRRNPKPLPVKVGVNYHEESLH